MPKVKALLVVLLVIAFSFSLLGCGLITSRTASTDEVVEMGGQVPEWLLLSHRSMASEESDIDDDLAAIDEENEDEEADEAVGGVDEDDGVAAGSASGDSDQTEQTTSEVAQAAETGSSGSTQQQETASSGSADSSSSEPKPGSREYMAWFAANRAQGEYDKRMLEWFASGSSERYDRWVKNKEEEESKSGGMDSDWFEGSPSGWGN